jgi:hypothetical protein
MFPIPAEHAVGELKNISDPHVLYSVAFVHSKSLRFPTRQRATLPLREIPTRSKILQPAFSANADGLVSRDGALPKVRVVHYLRRQQMESFRKLLHRMRRLNLPHVVSVVVEVGP